MARWVGVKMLLAALLVALVPFALAPDALAGARTFANCTAMHRSYPHGVGKPGARDHVARASDRPVTNFYRNAALYNANTKSDRDHDGIACEAH